MSTQTSTGTRHVRSADGTEIAYEVTGTGPAVVLVDGAMCFRALGPSRGLARELAGAFTVHAYDRRGRGDSGPGVAPYDVAREVEDLAAVIAAAGGGAHVLAVSSGVVLAFEAARRGVPIDRLATFEAPFILDDSRPPNDADLPERVQAMVDSGSRGRAVRTFLRVVGVPGPFIALMRLMPGWKKMTGVAHTLPYDLSMVVPHEQGRPLPAGCYADIRPRTLVMAGGRSPAWMRSAQRAIADALPDAGFESLAGQTHMVKPAVLAPVVTRHFLS